MSLTRWATWCATLAVVLTTAGRSPAGVRIKDITDLEGARGNQLYGFGLVVGLDGTGSKSLFTQQVAVDMLQKLAVGAKTVQTLNTDNVLKSNNISAVMVTAELGPFSRDGSHLDVTVSALDDASSLQGGVLLLTPLRGADSEVYAVALRPLVGRRLLVCREGGRRTKESPDRRPHRRRCQCRAGGAGPD